jgi:sigma-B regulation protein RsbU (phosphoserine phosphatase)
MTAIADQQNGQLKTRGKLLIVDDELSLRRALFVTLTELGFEIVEASTGEQALALIGFEGCDVVLLDVVCPVWVELKRAASFDVGTLVSRS